uniref:Uncharacterized protein n=1 Tax=Moniliophthora roreri TaxID=221103 RepID=A0A0W0FJR2_MONRR
MLPAKSLIVLALVVSEALCGPVQAVLQSPTTDAKPRQLQGRFLQITDMHPDPYYIENTSASKACHRKKPKKKKNRAGYYGTAYSECDSPLRLTSYTLNFLEKNWAPHIDFVIWTGDNARHDNDRKLPRTTNEIYELNRAVAQKMEDAFARKGIPVVPSLEYLVARTQFDNFNILIVCIVPDYIHSVFLKDEGLRNRIWKSFIPFPYRQVFQRGAYYSVEVVPDHLAVVALNTMYFYDSNKAVDGCPYTEPNDPGNLQLDWLEVQLKIFRERRMQVWLTGHVPPSRGNYFPECYVRYTDLALRYQDTIVGHLFGHMNADHFFFVEGIDLELEIGPQRSKVTANSDLYQALIEDFGKLPSTKKVNLDEFGVINVSPPAVPNPYLPTFRIFSYNVSGYEMAQEQKRKGGRKPGHHRGDHGDKTVLCKEKPYSMSWKCHLSNDSWYSDPEAPSRMNTLWTPTGYAQYYIPDLDDASSKQHPHYKLEYTTYTAQVLTAEGESPVPLKQLPKSLRNGTMDESKYAPYGMKDLTIGSWFELASRLGKEEGELHERFRKYMYLGV